MKQKTAKSGLFHKIAAILALTGIFTNRRKHDPFVRAYRDSGREGFRAISDPSHPAHRKNWAH